LASPAPALIRTCTPQDALKVVIAHIAAESVAQTLEAFGAAITRAPGATRDLVRVSGAIGKVTCRLNEADKEGNDCEARSEGGARHRWSSARSVAAPATATNRRRKMSRRRTPRGPSRREIHSLKHPSLSAAISVQTANSQDPSLSALGPILHSSLVKSSKARPDARTRVYEPLSGDVVRLEVVNGGARSTLIKFPARGMARGG